MLRGQQKMRFRVTRAFFYFIGLDALRHAESNGCDRRKTLGARTTKKNFFPKITCMFTCPIDVIN